jgi:pimeloyl-ACP methyl ester carboxylesterase
MRPEAVAPDRRDASFRSAVASVNGIDLHYVEAGPGDGIPLVLLHGFPEFWFGWRHQIPALAEAGFRVLALDQRGYNLSAKPSGVAAYDLDVLAADVVAFAEQMGLDRLAVVGHDWGASVAWWLATTQPRRLLRMAILNAPHPALWKRAMRHNPAQRRKSWYVYVMALPWLPELAMRANRFKALARSLLDSSRPGTFREDDLESYRRAWAQPGALTATLNWYRALLRKRFPETLPRIDVDTLMIWGVEDKFGDRSVAEESMALCSAGRAVFVDGATHWVHHEEPERVNQLLIEFLRGAPHGPSRAGEGASA